jgi:hypothetical protein
MAPCNELQDMCSLEPDFLSEAELFFLQNLSKNEALLEYYHQLQEGLVSLFI